MDPPLAIFVAEHVVGLLATIFARAAALSFNSLGYQSVWIFAALAAREAKTAPMMRKKRKLTPKRIPMQAFFHLFSF